MPLMYRHRPSGPALIAAGCILILGGSYMYCLYRRVDAGEASPESILHVAFLTIGATGALLILAFARYRFTHLWKHPDPAFSKRAKTKRKNGRL